MRRLVHEFRLACILLLAAAFSSSAVAASSVPFQATIDFHETVEFKGTAPCYLVGTIQGTGAAPRLGAFTVTSTDCINPLPLRNGSFGFFSSSVVLATSSGNLLATYMGVLSANGVISGTYLIYGGTGEFADASGSGILQGVETIDFANGVGSGRIGLRGTLSY